MRYKINFFDSLAVDTIDVVQGDTARVLELEPNDYTIPDGATATYFVAKPSGNAVYNTATIVDNAVVVHLTAQAIAEAGKSKMQVRLTIDDELLTSFTVILAVQKFRGIDAVESTTESNVFDQCVETAENAAELAQTVADSIPSDYTSLSEQVTYLQNNVVPASYKCRSYTTSKTTSDTVVDILTDVVTNGMATATAQYQMIVSYTGGGQSFNVVGRKIANGACAGLAFAHGGPLGGLWFFVKIGSTTPIAVTQIVSI